MKQLTAGQFDTERPFKGFGHCRGQVGIFYIDTGRLSAAYLSQPYGLF